MTKKPLTEEEKKSLIKILQEMDNIVDFIEKQTQNPRKCLKCGNTTDFKNINYGHSYSSMFGHRTYIKRKCKKCNNDWTIS
jgi:hypothetical protein